MLLGISKKISSDLFTGLLNCILIWYQHLRGIVATCGDELAVDEAIGLEGGEHLLAQRASMRRGS